MGLLDTRITALLGTRCPIAQAPMAGGFTPPEPVAAVSNAGAPGSLAGALPPAELIGTLVRETEEAIRRVAGTPAGG